MKAHSIKTDNDKLLEKVNIRKQAIKDLTQVAVLDLFAGNNVIWDAINTSQYYGIEIKKGKGKNVNADNRKIIPSLDLSKFNVIDCDTYGIPIEQIQLIYNNPSLKKGTIIFYTAITNRMCKLHKAIREQQGIDRMYKKASTLFNGHAIDYFYSMLYKLGVREVFEITNKKNYIKKYGYFVV